MHSSNPGKVFSTRPRKPQVRGWREPRDPSDATLVQVHVATRDTRDSRATLARAFHRTLEMQRVAAEQSALGHCVVTHVAHEARTKNLSSKCRVASIDLCYPSPRLRDVTWQDAKAVMVPNCDLPGKRCDRVS
jgi:hypothetical protein